MPSKILCAGFSKEEKGAVEAEVKPVIAGRPSDESWTISLVKTGSRLAVTVDGPDDRVRGKNFVAELWEIRQKLLDLLVNNGFPPVDPKSSPGMARPSLDPKSSPSIPKPSLDPKSSPGMPRPSAEPKSSPGLPKTLLKPTPPEPRSSPSIPKPAVIPKSVPAAPKAQPAAPKPAPARPAVAPPITPPPQPRVAAPLTPPPSRIVSTPPLQELEEEYDWESPHAVGERRKTSHCQKCQRRFAVIYEALPNEPQMVVSVACPHCWEVDRIEIGENAALSRAYRADQLKD
jgi:hypothetical protein